MRMLMCVAGIAVMVGCASLGGPQKKEKFSIGLYESKNTEVQIAADCVKSGGDAGDEGYASCGGVFQWDRSF